MLPTAEDSEAAGKEVEGPEKEQELGIGQVLENLEEVTNMLTSRWQNCLVTNQAKNVICIS